LTDVTNSASEIYHDIIFFYDSSERLRPVELGRSQARTQSQSDLTV